VSLVAEDNRNYLVDAVVHMFVAFIFISSVILIFISIVILTFNWHAERSEEPTSFSLDPIKILRFAQDDREARDDSLLRLGQLAALSMTVYCAQHDSLLRLG